MVRIKRKLEPSGDPQEASDSTIGVLSAREVMVARCAAMCALAVSSGIAENGGLISDMFVVDLHKKVTGKSSASAILSTDFAKTKAKNASE